MPYANVKTIKLYYEIEGSGNRVFLLNGRGGDLRNPRFPLRGNLAAGHTLLTYDHRGQGRSDNPEGSYSAEILAEDAAALLDALGWEKCAVIGPSFWVPTYTISGRYDGLLPADNAPLMVGLIAGARYDIVDHGHISWVFDPAVAEKIISFLSE